MHEHMTTCVLPAYEVLHNGSSYNQGSADAWCREAESLLM